VDIDLGEAIAKELGVAIEWQDTEFAQIFSSLQTGRVDMALQGISDLPDAGRWPIRELPAQRLAVLHQPGKRRDHQDAGGSLRQERGASRSTNWPKRIEEWSAANCVAKGKPAIKVVGTEGSADARTQLKSGRLDAAVQGLETLPYFQKLEPNTYVLIGQPFTEDLMGIPSRRKRPSCATPSRRRSSGCRRRASTTRSWRSTAAGHQAQSRHRQPGQIAGCGQAPGRPPGA